MTDKIDEKTRTQAAGHEVIELEKLFGEQTQKMRQSADTTSTVGSLDEVMQRYAKFEEKVRGYVHNAVESSRAFGLKVTGISKPDFWEKAFSYMPVFGGKLVQRHFQDRLKGLSLDASLNTLMDNVTFYAQGIELAAKDLAVSKDSMRQLQGYLIERQKAADAEIKRYATELEKLNGDVAGLEKALEGKSSTEKLEAEQVLNRLKDTREETNLQIAKYTFQAKCAADNYEYSKSIESQLTERVKQMKTQGVILESISKDSTKNMSALAKLLSTGNLQAGAVHIYNSVRDVMNEGLALAGDQTKTMAAETSRMLTADMYNPEIMKKAIEDALAAKQILESAVTTAYDKWRQQVA